MNYDRRKKIKHKQIVILSDVGIAVKKRLNEARRAKWREAKRRPRISFSEGQIARDIVECLLKF